MGHACYLYNPDLASDLGQRGVKVVGRQGLPPQSLVFVGPDPTAAGKQPISKGPEQVGVLTDPTD